MPSLILTHSLGIDGSTFSHLVNSGWCSLSLRSRSLGVSLNNTKQKLPSKQWICLMLVALILSDEIEAILVKVEAYEWFHCQYKVSQIESMLNLLAINTLYFKILIIKLDILVYAIVHNLHLVKTDKLPLQIR